MKYIGRKDVEKLIHQHLEIIIQLSEKNYLFYNIDNNTQYISYTSLIPPIKYIQNVHSIGIPILIIKKSKIIILPGLLYCISEEINSSQFDANMIIMISRGNSVKINKRDGILLIKDKMNRNVAIGLIYKGIFTPIVDIGWYLRKERMFSI